MSNLANDSIIKVYLRMIDKTQSDLKLPEYSEIYLRLALKEVCGINFELSPNILQLYRKLIVLYYCEKYPFLTSVITIMERCFSQEEIYNIIAEKNYVLGQWWKFRNNDIEKCIKSEC